MLRIITLLFFLGAMVIGISAQNTTKPRFWLIQKSKYADRVDKGKDIVLKRYLVLPDHVKFKKGDPITDKSEEEILARFAFAAHKANEGLQDWIIDQMSEQKDFQNLLKGLRAFLENRFEGAKHYMGLYQGPSQSFLKQLVIADSYCETAIDPKNIKPLLEQYQIAFDNAPDELSKQLVNLRIKYLKYRK
ncbi:MAG: hypothetical protein QM786_18605 [Breznakibacter sp.]